MATNTAVSAIANRYATALFELADEQARLDEVATEHGDDTPFEAYKPRWVDLVLEAEARMLDALLAKFFPPTSLGLDRARPTGAFKSSVTRMHGKAARPGKTIGFLSRENYHSRAAKLILN